MLKKYLIIILTISMIMSLSAHSFAIEHVPGEIIVKYRESGKTKEFTVQSRADIAASIDIQKEHGKSTSQLLLIVDELNSRPDVEFAQLNYIYRPLVIPDDTFYEQQWSINSTTDADMAWDLTTGSNNTVIAFIDTGIQMDHPDLASKIVKPYNAIDNNSDVDDKDGHGTHVAGIAAAHSNNSLGIAGVCWGCSIMPVKVLGDGGGTSEIVSRGIVYAVDNGADIISISIGISVSPDQEYSDPLLKSALDYAQMHGVLVVAASGNDACVNISYPAYYDNTLSVASSDWRGNLSSFSNCGSWVDVAAPGDNIRSTYIGSAYANSDGTSMAAPFVAGVAGLILSKNSTFDLMQLKSVLRTGVVALNGAYAGTGTQDIYLPLLFDSPPIIELKAVDDAVFSDWVAFNMTLGNFSNYSIFYGPGHYPDNFTLINFSYGCLINSSSNCSNPVFRAPSDADTGTLKVVVCDKECVFDSAVVGFNNSKITFPYSGYKIKGSMLEINVSVGPKDLENFTLEYLDGTWKNINTSYLPVSGHAVTWDVSGLALGQHEIRLLVWRKHGNFTANVSVVCQASVTGNITTDLSNVSIIINGSDNISKRFSGIHDISIFSDGIPVVEFSHDFADDLNLSNISVMLDTALRISGIRVPKTVYMTNGSAIGHLCIKDAFGNITSRCRGDAEYLVSCDNTTQYGFLCEAINQSPVLHRITGLSHTSVRPQKISEFSMQGNTSEILTNIINLSFEIDGTGNLSEWYLGVRNITIRSNNKTFIQASFNFSSSLLNFSEVIVISQNQTDSYGALAISGIDLIDKIMYLDDISAIDYVCIKDSADVKINAISLRCDLGDEILVRCDNSTQSGYRCEKLNGTYKLTGLMHTALIEKAPYVPPRPSGSSGSLASSISGMLFMPCISDYICMNWSGCLWSESQYRICYDSQRCNTTNITEYRGCDYDFCNDGIKNNDETDVDCAGGCKPCEDGMACKVDQDCISSCINFTCQKKAVIPIYKKLDISNCTDGILNQDEEMIDCGGVCGPCPSEFDIAPHLWTLTAMFAIFNFVWIIILYKD